MESRKHAMSSVPPKETNVGETTESPTPPQQYNTYKNWEAHDPQTFLQEDYVEKDTNQPCHDQLLLREAEQTPYTNPTSYPAPTEYQPGRMVPRSLMDKHMITKGWQSKEALDEDVVATNPSRLDVIDCNMQPAATKPMLPYHASVQHCQQSCEANKECYGFSHDGTHCTLLGNGVLTKNPGFIAGRSSHTTNTYIKSSQGKVCAGVHLKDQWDLRDCASAKARLKHVAQPLAPMKPFFNIL